MDPNEQRSATDTGLICLTILARLQHLPADPKQLQHEFGSSDHAFETRDLLRAAKWLGLKARSVRVDWDKLRSIYFPCIAKLANEQFVLIGGLKEDEILIKYPGEEAPKTLTREEFEAALG